MNTLFLNENPLSKQFTQGSIAGKELRLRAALLEVDGITAICLPGNPVEINNKKITEIEKKIHIVWTIKWPYYLSPIILFVYGFIHVMRFHPVVIEAESPILSGIAAVLLGKLFSIPVLIEVRASYDELIKHRVKMIPFEIKQKLLVRVLHFVYSRASMIVANSITYQRQIQKMGYRSVVINPGIQYAPRNNTCKRHKWLGTLGRLVPEKGINHFLRAVAKIQQELRQLGWSVVIAGEGRTRAELEKLVEFLQLNDLVTFVGFQPNFLLLRKMSVLVNPCLVKHPLEMANAEAAYMGVPVICYGDRIIPETVINNQTGIKVPYGNIDKLSDAIITLIRDPQKMNKFGKNGKVFARDHYDYSQQVRELRHIYREMKLI